MSGDEQTFVDAISADWEDARRGCRDGGPDVRRVRALQDRQTVVVEERFPGESETLRTDDVHLRRLLKLGEEKA
jgi:hypothetical protein